MSTDTTPAPTNADALRQALELCSAELFAQCADQPRAMQYVEQARAALASAAQSPADGALNTIAAMFHSAEEIEGPDGLAMMVDMALWNDALEAFDVVIGDEMEPAQPERVPLTEAARDVLTERQRQISVEGWTPEHDDKERLPDELALAAASYVCADEQNAPPAIWPWDWSWWKPSDRRRNLVKSGALILAEIERLDRAAARAAKEGGEHD